MLEYKGYIGTLEPEDGAFSGRVVGLRDVITFEGETYTDVEQAFQTASTTTSPSVPNAVSSPIAASAAGSHCDFPRNCTAERQAAPKPRA